MFGVTQCFIFVERKLGTEKEILKCVAVEDTMNNHVIIIYLKIYPVIFGAISVEFFSLSLNCSKVVIFSLDVLKVLVPHLELIKKFKLVHG